jgi:hypothetical protein
MAPPAIVTAAAMAMLILGGLIVLVGLILLIVGSVVGGVDSEHAVFRSYAGLAGEYATGILIGIALIVLALGIIHLIAGAYVLRGRSWARVTAIVVAAIMAILALSSFALVIGSPSYYLATGTVPVRVAVGLAIIGAYAFVIRGLTAADSWFAAESSRLGAAAQSAPAPLPQHRQTADRV